MLTYTIDCGNSFLKIAKFNDGQILEVQRFRIEEFQYQFESGAPIIYSNVTNDISDKLPKNAYAATNLINNFNTTYDESGLGIDRKVISYYLQNKGLKEVLLVDAGSFITFDEIRDGIHQGGAIYLGLDNYLNAYPKFSAKLPLISCIEDGNSNTRRAISLAYKAYLSMLKTEISKFNNCEVFITGGDATKFSDCGEVCENLIHEALFSLRDLI